MERRACGRLLFHVKHRRFPVGSEAILLTRREPPDNDGGPVFHVKHRASVADEPSALAVPH
ncbi:hypothetical protein GCM10027187_11990 [Streptosporangium sandarakinum]